MSIASILMGKRLRKKKVKNQGKKSIQKLLIKVVLSLVIVTVTTEASMSLATIYRTSKTNVIDKMELSKHAIGRVLNSINKSVKDTTDIIANKPEVKNMKLNEIESYLENNIENFSYISRVSITNEKGMQVAKYPKTGYADVSDREYFKKSIKGESSFSEVIISKSTNSRIIIYSTPIIDNNNKVIGIVSATMDLKDYIDEILKMNEHSNTSVLLVDYLGNLILDSESYQEEHSISEEVISMMDFGPVPEVIKGNSGVIEFSYQESSSIASYEFLPETNWGIIISSKNSTIYKDLYMTLGKLILVIIIILIIAAILTFRITNNIVRPIKSITHQFNNLADGNLDVEIDSRILDRNDEISQLGNALLQLRDKTTVIVKGIKGNAIVLLENAEKTNSLINRKNDRLQSTWKMTRELNISATSNLDNASVSISALHEISQGVNEVSKNVQTLFEVIDETTVSSKNAADHIKETVGALEVAVKNSDRIEGKMEALENSTREISKFGEIILDIARQTNLLALNAAIESARAGEAGRGFAVVADEVNKLSGEVSRAAAEINKTVGNIALEIKDATNLVMTTSNELKYVMDEANDSIDNMEQLVTKSFNSLVSIESINSVVEEQTAFIEETTASMELIVEAMGNTNLVIDKVNNNNKEQSEALQEISYVSNSLEEVSKEINDNIGYFKGLTK